MGIGRVVSRSNRAMRSELMQSISALTERISALEDADIETFKKVGNSLEITLKNGTVLSVESAVEADVPVITKRFSSDLGLPEDQGFARSFKGSTRETMSQAQSTGPDFIRVQVPPVGGGFSYKNEVSSGDWDRLLRRGGIISTKMMILTAGHFAQGVFLGLGFTSANDPRTSSGARMRYGVSLGLSSTTNGQPGGDWSVAVSLTGGSGVKVLDGLDNRPSVAPNSLFDCRYELAETPDDGANFGPGRLFINNQFIDEGEIRAAGNSLADNAAYFGTRTGTGAMDLYIESYELKIFGM